MLKNLAQSIGLAAIILAMNYGGLLGGGADVRMHVPFALGGIVMAQLLCICVLGLLIFAVLTLLRRTRLEPWVQVMLAIAVPPFLLARMQTLSAIIVRDNLVVGFAVVWTALVVMLLVSFPVGYRRLLRLGDAAGIFLALFAFCNVLQLLWLATWRPAPQQYAAAWQTGAQPPRQHPRVVWIIFDELSYDQVFEHRAHDLDLPNFDALRNESTVLTNVQPAGYKTVKIIPSLFTGKVIDDFRFKFNNRFLVHYTGERGWHPLDGSGTVFHDAQQAGFRTAAVGWYNPYCTLYRDALDSCYWMNFDSFDGLMSQRKSVLQNTYTALRQVAVEAAAPERGGRDSCGYEVRQRIWTHLDLEQHAMDTLQSDQADFVYLHMSIPHSPNIWSRADDAYIRHCDSSYLDNLALVDRTLGEVMKTLHASPRWKDTTVIVEGDHGWRIDLWNYLPAWTEEDDDASRGKFDPRPALLIHAAGQQAPQTIDAPWPLLRVHDVLEQALHGQPIRYTP